MKMTFDQDVDDDSSLMRHRCSEHDDSDAEAANMMILKSDLASNEKSSVGWREDTRGGCRWEKLHYHDLPVSWTCGNSGNRRNSIKIWIRQWEKRRENCKVWIHQSDPEGIASCTCIYLERSLFIVFPLSIKVLKNWVICVIIWSCMNWEDEQCEACFSPELKRFCLIAGAPASRSWVIVQYLKLSNWQQRSD